MLMQRRRGSMKDKLLLGVTLKHKTLNVYRKYHRRFGDFRADLRATWCTWALHTVG